jgi:digalactosyldiacylglycerol synthase
VACDIGMQDEFGQDVPPLDLPELLENLIRESEPLLDQLGFRKGTHC